MGMTIYASRTAESLNSDPLPEVNPDGTRAAIGEGRPTYEPGAFGKMIESVRYDPRPSFTPKTTHPANPVLDWFRSVVDDPKCGTKSQVIEDFLTDPRFLDEKFTPDQITHARAVLSRLAAFHA